MMRKTPWTAEEIKYWYLVPVQILFHYHADGEESVMETVLDIPMTEANITGMKDAVTQQQTTEERALEHQLNAVLAEVKHALQAQLPPEKRPDCTISITINGPIRSSKEPLS